MKGMEKKKKVFLIPFIPCIPVEFFGFDGMICAQDNGI
jgi:hypothetical protein